MPRRLAHGAHALAGDAHLRDPAAGAAFLARAAPPLLARASGLLLAGCLLIAVGPRTRRAAAVLFVATCADLLVANRGLNPTTESPKLAPPAWYTAVGRVRSASTSAAACADS